MNKQKEIETLEYEIDQLNEHLEKQNENEKKLVLEAENLQSSVLKDFNQRTLKLDEEQNELENQKNKL